jgi:type II secretory pathway pseudopilin PulG
VPGAIEASGTTRVRIGRLLAESPIAVHLGTRGRRGTGDGRGRRASDGGAVTETGFTVLELLIVIALIGAIAITVQISTTKLHERAVTASCKEAVKEIETSAEVVRAKTASYPAPVDGQAKAANPLLVNEGALSRWPENKRYTLAWNGRDVDVTDLRHHTRIGSGAAACRALAG